MDTTDQLRSVFTEAYAWADVIEDAAFSEVVKRIVEATGVEAYIGHK